MNAEFWRDRRVLVTGHTGFKGAWLSLWLRSLGAEVSGFALPPATSPNLCALLGADVRSILGDLRDERQVGDALERCRPQIVLHLAAQALVRESYADPLGTYRTNVIGTANLLDACRRQSGLQGVVVVTSDKVYENDGAERAFEEGDRLGGSDPYSNSKACAELVTACFRDSFFRGGPPLATVRAGNVIGGGDWSADRLIPDCLRALDGGAPVRLRYPQAVRPWQHVLDPLAGYLSLAAALAIAPQGAPRAVNFGPNPASFCTVSDVVEAFSARFGGKPGWARDAGDHPPEAQTLRLSSALAERALGWRARLDIAAALKWTADWHLAQRAGDDMLRFTLEQIRRYQQAGPVQP
ncbi:MAG TPA: CDP-glucose 4,6-dehydratase [Steroidobacteraceae bacterium]|nr:CDP-glucose 4,6-dehydratase [Steroidobacteraceae bacterium]